VTSKSVLRSGLISAPQDHQSLDRLDAAELLAARGVDVLTIDLDQHRPCDTIRVISAATDPAG
jgi:transketolase C-terminal domain/subunit